MAAAVTIAGEKQRPNSTPGPEEKQILSGKEQPPIRQNIGL